MLKGGTTLRPLGLEAGRSLQQVGQADLPVSGRPSEVGIHRQRNRMVQRSEDTRRLDDDSKQPNFMSHPIVNAHWSFTGNMKALDKARLKGRLL